MSSTVDLMVRHSAYPHLVGSMFDCPGCEARCYCKPGETRCVCCAIADETSSHSRKAQQYIDRFNY